MVISPEGYVKSLEGRTYGELLKERDKLLKEILEFEGDKDADKEETMGDISPDVQYQMNLEYLGKLCKLIAKVYSRDHL